MELIIQVLMMFIVVNTALKLSFWSKWWQPVLFGIVCGVFVIATCQWAILQSKTQLADYLINTKTLQNVAVLITLEAVFFFAFCFSSLLTDNNRKPNIWMKLLNWYPGLLIFFVLFYLLTQTIYAFPGVDFKTTSYVMAGVVAVGLPALSLITKYMLPEKELRMEVLFLVGLFVCVFGLITTVNGNVTYAASGTDWDVNAIIWAAGLFITAFFAGLFMSKLKWILFSRKIKNK